MKLFNHLKQLIKEEIAEKTYNEVDIDGVTFKEIIVDEDFISFESNKKNGISINTDYLIINGNGHTVDLNHKSNAFDVIAENVIIKNFNFKNGNGNDGGVIHNEGVVKIDNCTFKNCEAFDGGAIYNKGVLIIDNSSFENNSGNYYNGGAIYNMQLLLISNSNFIDNHAKQYGGAIFNDKKLFVEGCTFKGNSSKSYGGTIKNNRFFSLRDVMEVSSKGLDEIMKDCTIKNCVFEDSELVIRTSAEMDMENCIFRNNRRIISIVSSTVNINNCLFENNHSYLIGNTYSSAIPSYVSLKNCDFKNNQSELINDSHLLKSILFEIAGDKKFWNVKNCQFENNASNYIFRCKSADITFENVSFNDNDFVLILTDRQSDDGKVLMNNVTFKEKLENLISYNGDLEINDCKFQKHHYINKESVFEIYKSEQNFISKLI